MPEQALTCAGCENDVRFRLTSLEGVRQVKPDQRAKPVDVDSALIGLERIRRAVEHIEYRLVGS